MYYLQSRYYDPEVGRFLNADAFASTGQGILGNNMFAYCLNNPVNGCDPCGTCLHRWDFWNDCEECIGKTLGEKANDAKSKIIYHNRQQAKMQMDVTGQQLQMMQNSIKRGLKNQTYQIQMQIEAQYRQDMTIIVVGEYYAANPQKAIDHTFAILGACELYLAFAVSKGVAIPAIVMNTLKNVGKAGVLWGAYRMIEEIIEDIFGMEGVQNGSQ